MSVERGVVYLVGAGPGDPGLMTLRGREVLSQADCVIYDYLLHPQALDGVPALAERIFVGKRGGAQVADQEAINRLLIEHAGPDKVVVRLKGGDPFCFGRGGEEARALRRSGIPFRVVPGVTSGIAAPAYAGIPITDREAASSVCFLTGHEQAGGDRHDWSALAKLPTLVVYMGVRQFPRIRDQLLAAGRSPETPVAAIRWGTWPHQQVLLGKLGDMVKRMAERQFAAPAILVIGHVASFARELDWCQLGPLAGRQILVAGVLRGDPLTLALEAAGARVLHCPGEAIEQPLAVPAQWWQSLPACRWLIFTSGAGVRHFMQALLRQHPDLRCLAQVDIGVIGPSCAAELARFHLQPRCMPQVHDSRHLVEALLQAGIGQCQGEIWHPGAAEVSWTSGPSLAAHGVTCRELPVYRQQWRSQVMRLGDEPIDAVCLSSPSALRRLRRHADPEDLQRLIRDGAQFCAIGQATADLMVSQGWPVHLQAPRPTTSSLVDTIITHYAPGSSI